MNVLHKKMKKVSIFAKLVYYLTVIIYIAALAYFVYGIAKLKGIETTLRIVGIVILCVWLGIYLLGALLCMLTKKRVIFAFLTTLTLLFGFAIGYVSYNLNDIFARLSKINHETVTYTTNLIALKGTEYNSNLIFGMVESSDNAEGQLAVKLYESKKWKNDIKSYEDYETMLADLYKGKIDACFVSSNYKILFKEDYPNIEEEVIVLEEYSENMKNEDNQLLLHSSSKDLTEPFTMLVMGVDSEKDGLTANQAFNGDTLIMITFNPNTLTATMFSIPRDMYVPIACNNNRYNKINSSAAYGSSCVIRTVEQLTGIKIDYYLKMNFKGVVKLVDALGGVEVEVEEPDFAYPGHTKNEVCEQDSNRAFGNNLVCVPVGKQTLNGEQALAYSRCRHLYAISDIARNQHQQDIIEAMARKIKQIRNLDDFRKVLDAISNNLETNMTTEQILSLYNVGKDMLLASGDNNQFAIVKTHLAYYNLPVYIAASDSYTSALGYYPESLNAITKAMRVNLGKESETPIKSYSISYNDKYEPKVVGRGITGGAKLTLMPGFEGYSKSKAQEWCSSSGVSCEFTVATDPNPEGQILTQSVHDGTLMKNVSHVTFVVSNGQGSTNKDKDDDDDDDDDDKDNNKDDNGNDEPGGDEPGGNEPGGNEPGGNEPTKPEPDDEVIDETGDGN